MVRGIILHLQYTFQFWLREKIDIHNWFSFTNQKQCKNLPQGLGSKWAKLYTKLKCGQKPPLFLRSQVYKVSVIICAFILEVFWGFLKQKIERINKYMWTYIYSFIHVYLYTYIYICVYVSVSVFSPLYPRSFQPGTLQELI